MSDRGFYFPIKDFGHVPLPKRMADLIFVEVSDTGELTRVYDHGIYVRRGTCSDETALAMTFGHELQHFVQYGFKREFWAGGKLSRELSRQFPRIQEKERLNWPDIPHEREARIVAKRIGVDLCGRDASRGLRQLDWLGRFLPRRLDDASGDKVIDLRLIHIAPS